MMGIMAKERGGQVFATDERYVKTMFRLCPPIQCKTYQLLHRQWNHDRPSGTVELPYGFHHPSRKKYMYTEVCSDAYHEQ